MFGNLFRNLPPVTKNLLLINIFIFLIMVLAPAGKAALIDRYLALHYVVSPDFNPAQIFTYMFLHGGWWHLFFNMFALLMFGPHIEYSLGSKRFLFYFISCGIGAALVQLGVYAIIMQKYAEMFTPDQLHEIIVEGCKALNQNMNYTDPTLANLNITANGKVVGASGAVYGVLLAFGMLFPNLQIYLMIPPMPIKAKYMVIGYAVLELLLGLNNADNVAHFCHLGGMLIGFLIILYWKKQGTFNGRY